MASFTCIALLIARVAATAAAVAAANKATMRWAHGAAVARDIVSLSTGALADGAGEEAHWCALHAVQHTVSGRGSARSPRTPGQPLACHQCQCTPRALHGAAMRRLSCYPHVVPHSIQRTNAVGEARLCVLGQPCSAVLCRTPCIGCARGRCHPPFGWLVPNASCTAGACKHARLGLLQGRMARPESSGQLPASCRVQLNPVPVPAAATPMLAVCKRGT